MIVLFLLGYTIFELSSSDQTGGKNKFDLMIGNILGRKISTSLRFNIDWVHCHIHHWLLCFIGVLLFSIWELPVLVLLCLGGMAQGIYKYDDWMNVITVE
jgi:hypothetical protein